jgi:4-hydroxy-tetrahydrodipicolinate synthase
VHPYLSLDGWVDYHRAIADALPDLGVVLYVRDPRIGGAQIASLCEQSPNVLGVKYAVPDPVRFAGTAQDAGPERVVWLAGLAELSAPGYWAVGARGFTSGLVNIAPALSMELLESLCQNDFPAAMKTWQLVRPIEELRAADASSDNVSVIKEALAQLGLARRDVRPPGRLLPEHLRTRIAEILSTWGDLG